MPFKKCFYLLQTNQKFHILSALSGIIELKMDRLSMKMQNSGK